MLRKLPQWRVRWRMEGVRPEIRTESGRGLARNPFHFTEGYGNPASPAEIAERATVQAGQGEPAWAVGGSYQVIRIIRLATDFWDRDTLHDQEHIIGRRRDGRWLDGTPPTSARFSPQTPMARSHHLTPTSAGQHPTDAIPRPWSGAATTTNAAPTTRA